MQSNKAAAPYLLPLLVLPLTAASCTRIGGRGEREAPAAEAPRSAPVPYAGKSVRDTLRLSGLTGTFHAIDSPPFRSGRKQFEMSLHGDNVHVGFARYGAGRPQKGRYPLAPLDRADPGGRFYATVSTGGEHVAVPGDTIRSYVSISGELIITESSPERVAGRFHFTSAEYAASWYPAGRSGSGTPSTVPPGTRTLEVQGSFTASPFGVEGMVVCAGTGGPSVLVEVRDPEGRPAASGTTIVIQEGSFRDSVDGAHAVDALHVGAGERRPGVYEVRLHKPGYRSVVLHHVQAPPSGTSACHYAVPWDVRSVTLEPLPDAPAVRSVVVIPPSMSLGAPGLEVPMRAIVDAAPGVSQMVRWSSSDPTVAVISPAGVLRSQCRGTRGEAVITATSVADPHVRGEAHFSVSAARPMPGLRPPEAVETLKACLERLPGANHGADGHLP